MANTYFQFKQFIVQQSYCAMKVCTDSCLFGAVLPIQNAKGERIKAVLDIGTGTGLLSLQYAQLNSKANITAIEIDVEAYKQAKENFSNSIFAKQLLIEQADFTTWQSNIKFDLVICNPPFYKNDLKSDNEQKNIAHHSTALQMNNLFSKAIQLLEPNGIFAILLPTEKLEEYQLEIIKNNWHTQKVITIHQNEKLKKFRTILFLTLEETKIELQTVLIKENGVYSKTFQKLLQPFYLDTAV